jgi:hypothetical protein
MTAFLPEQDHDQALMRVYQRSHDPYAELYKKLAT